MWDYYCGNPECSLCKENLINLGKTKKEKDMPLFEVAILERPTKKEAEEGKTEKLVFGPTPVIASNEQSAGIVAILDSEKEALKINRNQMEVLVRPFVAGQ